MWSANIKFHFFVHLGFFHTPRVNSHILSTDGFVSVNILNFFIYPSERETLEHIIKCFFIRLQLLNPKIYTQNGLKRVFFFQTRSIRNRRMTMAPKIDLMRPRNSINKIVSNQYGIPTPDFIFCFFLFCGRFSELITYVIICFLNKRV